MTDNEIIKALEICLPLGSDCSLCPLLEETHCYDHLLSEVLDLFNRQKAEIEKKDTELDILIRKNETLKDENFELKAEIERLKVRNDELNFLNKTATIDAIKEVADSLQSILDEHTLQNGDVHFVALYKAVEKFTKELVGESNV